MLPQTCWSHQYRRRQAQHLRREHSDAKPAKVGGFSSHPYLLTQLGFVNFSNIDQYLIFQVHSAHSALRNLLCFVIHVLNPRELRIVPGNLCNRCGHSIFFVTSKVFAWGSKSLAVALLSFRSIKIARGSTSSAKGYKSTSPGAKSVSVGRLTRKQVLSILISILFLELFTPHNPQFSIYGKKIGIRGCIRWFS